MYNTLISWCQSIFHLMTSLVVRAQLSMYQNEAKRLFVIDWCLTGHNGMVQQTSWQGILMCIFIVKPSAVWSLYYSLNERLSRAC